MLALEYSAVLGSGFLYFNTKSFGFIFLSLFVLEIKNYSVFRTYSISTEPGMTAPDVRQNPLFSSFICAMSQNC